MVMVMVIRVFIVMLVWFSDVCVGVLGCLDVESV